MSRKNIAAGGTIQRFPEHVDANEYEAFAREHNSNHRTADRCLRQYRNFVKAYPDLNDWFQAPLVERVGRLHIPGSAGSMEEIPHGLTCRTSYEARTYLNYLSLSGRVSFDWEWLLAVGRLSIWKLLRQSILSQGANQLTEEAIALGYSSEFARNGLRNVLCRLFLHTGDPDVRNLNEHHLDEFLQAARSFGKRNDLELFFNSQETYRLTLKDFSVQLHMLRVVLFHRGQIDTEPRKTISVKRERGELHPEMEAMIERYLTARRASKRPSTVYQSEIALRRFAEWLEDEYPDITSFVEIHRDHLLEYAEDLAQVPNPRTGNPYAAESRSSRLSSLSVFFRDTADWGWSGVPGRPLLGYGDLPKVAARVPRYIPEEELSRLMQAIRALECPYQRTALLVARWSGARAGEILRLEEDCLDRYPDGTARLRIPAGKTYEERVVPLNEEAADAIREILRIRQGEPVRGFRDDLTGTIIRHLFVHHGRVFSRKYLFDSALQVACRAAGLVDAQEKPKVTPHRFRHTVGTQLAERGAQLQTIMKVLGQQSSRMALRYARISDETVLEDYQQVLGPGTLISESLAYTLRSAALADADVRWVKETFIETEFELGYCLRLPQEGSCECDLYLDCAKFVTSQQYAPRLRARRERERELIQSALSHGWRQEVDRHGCTLRRIEQLLEDLGEPLE